MVAIIIDSCSYTQRGLTGYLSSWGWEEKEIYAIDNVNDLILSFTDSQPSVVFLNEDFFVHNQEQCLKIKNIIIHNPGVLFIAFITHGNVHWNNYLRIKSNFLVCSKNIKMASLDTIYRLFLRGKRQHLNDINMPILSLKRDELFLLGKWMAGFDVNQIATQMAVTPKAVYTHKFGIRAKFETHSTQVVYHVYRLIERIAYSSATSSQFANQGRQPVSGGGVCTDTAERADCTVRDYSVVTTGTRSSLIIAGTGGDTSTR